MFNLFMYLMAIAFTVAMALVFILIATLVVKTVIESYRVDINEPAYRKYQLKWWQYALLALTFMAIAFVMTGFVWIAGIKLLSWIGGF
ncbi:hypothetical protein [Lactobacillus jensenii]|uniref:hypothetical protein n=1 Tax=Lactobacillus jensenii TaxID=109790 RepID=UPI00039886B1|nr:hypothetical protein [Lactobacillus jensenii]ERJ44144.1 hypothetical protein N581_07925 [Lactobacillus jensenii MD IIE-70(2)]